MIILLSSGKNMRQTEPDGGVDWKFAALACVVTAVIVYWSLFPFEWLDRTGDSSALTALLSSYRDWPPRADLLANILLYMPFGFFAVQAFRQRPLYLALTAAAGMALSVTMELTQFYDRGRVTSLSDVCANSAGTLLGGVLGYELHRQTDARLPERFRQRPYVLLLVGCWLGSRLFPYVPTVDLHAYWTAVKPLFRSPQLPFPDLYRHTVTWLALALLLQALTGVEWSRLAFLLFVPMVEGLRILIGTPLSPAEVLGGTIALVLWAGGLARLRARALMVAALFTLMVILRGLAPFHFLDTGRSFQWVPFHGFVTGDLSINIEVFLEKTFLYGSLVWLWVRGGLVLITATVANAAVVLSVGFAQVFLPGRSAELTDTAMLIITAAILKAMAEDQRARPDARTG
jgi:VanZ family protein